MITDLQSRVLNWYAANRRELPWRDETDPYRILVSEIMLQQTGVARVAPIYARFLDQFPAFEALAEAPRQDVLRAWAGAGYNRRAIRLHDCARIVCRDHGGRLPDDPETLAGLPGLGPYTVAALLSFAFHRDVPALDTNVRRVLGRVHGATAASDRELQAIARGALPEGRSSDWNQALMDLGATVCLAAKPRCLWCPLRDGCASSGDGDEVAVGRSRRVAERREPYLGSRRFFRGKIVAILRELPVGAWISPRALLGQIKPESSLVDQPWLDDILRGLVADGLATIEGGDDEARITAPT
ncbi:MAG: A/G-specific adenine glycosylase [Chloroflexota bacterium]